MIRLNRLDRRQALTFSDDGFLSFCRQNRDLRIEQTAAERRTGLSWRPIGGETGSRNNEVSRQLGNWARQDEVRTSRSTRPPATPMPNGAKRSPDASWAAPRLTAVPRSETSCRSPGLRASLRRLSDSGGPQDKMAVRTTALAWAGRCRRAAGALPSGAESRFWTRPFARRTWNAASTLDLTYVWEPGFCTGKRGEHPLEIRLLQRVR